MGTGTLSSSDRRFQTPVSSRCQTGARPVSCDSVFSPIQSPCHHVTFQICGCAAMSAAQKCHVVCTVSFRIGTCLDRNSCYHTESGPMLVGKLVRCLFKVCAFLLRWATSASSSRCRNWICRCRPRRRAKRGSSGAGPGGGGAGGRRRGRGSGRSQLCRHQVSGGRQESGGGTATVDGGR